MKEGVEVTDNEYTQNPGILKASLWNPLVCTTKVCQKKGLINQAAKKGRIQTNKARRSSWGYQRADHCLSFAPQSPGPARCQETGMDPVLKIRKLPSEGVKFLSAFITTTIMPCNKLLQSSVVSVDGCHPWEALGLSCFQVATSLIHAVIMRLCSGSAVVVEPCYMSHPIN